MKYLSKIKNDELRRALEEHYEENIDLWHLRPPSADGTEHPEDEDFGGGMVLHSDRVAWGCLQAAEFYDLPASSVDLLLTAAYFHDWSTAHLLGYKRMMFNFGSNILRGYQLNPSKRFDEIHPAKSAKLGCTVVKDIITHEDLVLLHAIISEHHNPHPKDASMLVGVFSYTHHLISQSVISFVPPEVP